MIPLPDPPLRSGTLLLRPWEPEDAPALVEAWADPEIQRWTGVPAACDRTAAERWIAGDGTRRARGLSLDLVVERAGAVAGEVGGTWFDRAAMVFEIGWWTGSGHRRQGVASGSVRQLADWLSASLGATVIARCDPANEGALRVARAAGFRRGPLDAPILVWVRP